MSIDAMKQALEALERGKPQITGVLVQQDQDAAITALRAAIADAEKQEPILYINPSTLNMAAAHVGAWKPGHELPDYIPLYTTPPAAQRQWVGLKAKERTDLWDSTDFSGMPEHDYGKAIEAKLKEKNT